MDIVPDKKFGAQDIIVIPTNLSVLRFPVIDNFAM